MFNRGSTHMGLALLLLATACERVSTFEPPVAPTLDAELRQTMSFWGAMPIRAVPQQNTALVDLGQSLFFDKELSGNRDVSCATCHEPLSQMTDGLSLAVGTGGSGLAPNRTLGAGRPFVPRNAPSLINQGLGFVYTLWDGRVNQEGSFGPVTEVSGPFTAPAGIVLPAGLQSLLAAQAMLPILNRVEMRGNPGDQDVFGAANEMATVSDADAPGVWRAAMNRLLAFQGYATKFSAAYPGVPASGLGFQHAANALAAFQIQSFTRVNSAFDRYLARDNRALTDEQKRGGILFFGKAQCASCHQGALLGGQQFANIGIPQFGPGVGAAAPLDIGRAEHIGAGSSEFYRFNFRVPALRNVELTAPYMHNGAYRTLESVVRHYTNADSSLRNYDATQLPPALRATVRRDAASINDVLRTLDFRLRAESRPRLTLAEQRDIVAFLKSLTDPAARDLAQAIPVAVPSGLSVRD